VQLKLALGSDLSAARERWPGMEGQQGVAVAVLANDAQLTESVMKVGCYYNCMGGSVDSHRVGVGRLPRSKSLTTERDCLLLE